MEYLLEDTQATLVLLGPEQEAIIKEIDPGLTNIVIHTERPYQDCNFFSSASDTMPQIEIKTRRSRTYHLHLRYHWKSQGGYPYTGKSCL